MAIERRPTDGAMRRVGGPVPRPRSRPRQTGQAAIAEEAAALLVLKLPYDLHVRFLSALAATARGDDAQAVRDYLEAGGRARLLLIEAGLATDADVLDPEWDTILLRAAREVVRAERRLDRSWSDGEAIATVDQAIDDPRVRAEMSAGRPSRPNGEPERSAEGANGEAGRRDGVAPARPFGGGPTEGDSTTVQLAFTSHVLSALAREGQSRGESVEQFIVDTIADRLQRISAERELGQQGYRYEVTFSRYGESGPL